MSSPITTPIGCERWGATVTAGWVDCSISSSPNSAISQAWIAGPPPESSDGLSAVVSVAGEFTGTESGKRAAMREAILRVWEARLRGLPRLWLELDSWL